MNPLSAVRQRLTDCLREQRIRDLRERIASERSPVRKRLWWIDLRDEINARSPTQVSRMEQEMGIGQG